MEVEGFAVTGVRGEVVSSDHYVYGKSPLLATALSFCVIGLGQLYNGDMKKGIMMFLGVILLGVLTAGLAWFPFAAWSMFDAYKVAKGDTALWR